MKRQFTSIEEMMKAVRQYVDAVAEPYEKASGKHATVKIKDGSAYANGKPVDEVASMVEYGTRYMEPRPFLRKTMIDKKDEWGMELTRRLKGISEGKGSNYTQAFKAVADVMAEDVKDTITDMGAVDTGTLRDSIVGDTE